MRLYIYKLSPLLAGCENHNTVNKCENSVILTHAHIQARVMLCATLALDNIAGLALRPTEDFHTKSFAF